MFSKKNKKKAFTLIEMLIVIVIIGILMAAIYPRLSNARGRANDVARKAALSQTAAALVSYQIDHGKFPECPTATQGCTLDEISAELVAAGMSSIPTDPNNSRIIDPGVVGVDDTSTEWQYAYITIQKWWIDDNGFVLMAATETEWWSNWVATGNIAQSYSYENISNSLCSEFWSAGCAYNDNNDELRYIYIY